MTAKTTNVRLSEAHHNHIEELAKVTATKRFLTTDALTHYGPRETLQVRDVHEGVAHANAGEFATDDQVNAMFAKYGA